MSTSRLLRPLLVLLLLALALPLGADELPAAERKQRERVAALWLKLGKRALKSKLREQARSCLEEARRAVGPEPAPVQAYARACRELSGEARASALGSFVKRAAKTRTKAAGLYERLAEAKEVPAARRGLYAWEALRLAPSAERWEGLAPALEAAWRAGERAAAGEAALAALELDPPAEVREQLEQLARLRAVGAVVLRQARGHPMRYYLALPDDYDPAAERPWPVLVTVDGAGSGFEGTAKAYANLARKRKLSCVVVAPCGFANTNAIQGKMKEKYLRWYDEAAIAAAERDRHAFDLAGLVAVLDELRADFGVAPQVCITGFSGGGNLTYQMIFKRPELLLAAAPACANFSRPGWAAGERSPEARALPIHVITGGKDPHRQWTHGKRGSPGIEPQTDAALAALQRAGLTRFKRTLLPELGHSPARRQVLDFFAPYLRGEKERGDPWP